MAWYRTGTVTVTQGSVTITGAGTDFVSNAVMGDGFRGPDGRTCEIARVVSATELTLAEGYAGPSAGGQPYAIQPTQSYLRDLAQTAATLLATFGAVRDGVGQGLFGDGSLAAPGVRFVADPDTGLYRDGPNALSLSTGGVRSVRATAVGLGFDAGLGIYWNGNGSEMLCPTDGATGWVLKTDGAFTFKSQAGVTRLSVMPDGRLSAPAGHVMARPGTTENNLIAGFGFDSGVGIQMRTAGGPAGNQGPCAMWINCNSTNGRSINASGTVNASGADYAEYMTKAAGCGTIAPGDVCGVDVDGKLTRTWADAISFVVKSTDPAYVGGDTWADALPPRPNEPVGEPIAPAAPALMPSNEDQEAAWRAAVAAYPAAQAAWQAAHAEWQAAEEAFARDMAAWEVALEAERVKVDRIAFCGQVPVNVTGDFAVGDYLIAAPAGAGIKAVAIPAADISFDQYRRRLGKVWAVRDGRAWVDVQHG